MFKRSGFTLIEISVVLIIIGLIIAGIMVGQTLIKGAELRALGNEMQKLELAMYAFKNKYNGFPGDLADATSFWSGATNGNGNGLTYGSTEATHFFEELYWAEFISSNPPTPSLKDAAFYIKTGGGAANGSSAVDYYSTASNVSSNKNPPATAVGVLLKNISNYSGALAATDARSLDNKIDDGKGTSGKLGIYDKCNSTGLPDVLDTGSCSGNGAAPFVYGTSSAKTCNMVYWFSGGFGGLGNYDPFC